MSDLNSASLGRLSRRAVLAGPAALSAPMGALAAIASADDCIPLCKLWLANEAEQDRLMRRWGDLETDLARNFQWFKLTEDERKALPQAAPLYAIDDRLDHLFGQRVALAPRLPRSKATTREGVMLKFQVVERELHLEDFPAIHGLLKSAIRDLAVLW